MSGQTVSFSALVIIATAAFFTPIIVNRIKAIRIPVVVGELIVGIVIGRSGFDIVKPEPWLDFLSILGITYLMFLSGVEIDFRLMRKLSSYREGRQVFALTTLYFALVLLGGIGAGYAFRSLGLVDAPWLIALMLCTVSVGVVMPMIKEKGYGATEYGQTLLVTALFIDFVTMLLLAGFVTLATGGNLGELGLIFLLFLAVFIFYRAGSRFSRGSFVADLAHATSQIGVRGSFMLIFILAFLSENLGVEIILGAFLAGAVVSVISESDETSLHLKLDAIGFGFLVPIFFIMVGAEFDLEALLASPESILLAGAIVVAAYAIKVLPSLIFVRRYKPVEAIALGVLVTPGLSLTVAAAEIGFRLDMLNSATHSAVILLAIVTAALSPVLFERLLPGRVEKVRERLIVVGANERGLLLAKRLSDYGDRLTLVDKDAARTQSASLRGYRVVAADAEQIEVWQQLGPDDETTVVVTTLVDETNLRIAEILREHFEVGSVIAHANDPEVAERMQQLGVRAVTPAVSTITVMENLVRHPNLFALLNQEDDDIAVEKLVVSSPALAGARLRELNLPEGALILAIGRGREHVIPRGDTRLQIGDVLTVAGQGSEVAEALRRLRDR